MYINTTHINIKCCSFVKVEKVNEMYRVYEESIEQKI